MMHDAHTRRVCALSPARDIFASRRWSCLLKPFVCLCLAFAGASVAAAGQDANLLGNADFENADAAPWEKRTPDDKDRALSIAPEAARGGKLGARIVNRTGVWSRWRQGADGALRVPAGSTVRLSGWIRTDLGCEGYATLRLYCMRDMNNILSQPAARPLAGKSDWRRVSLTTVVPDGAAFLMAYLELQNASGTADYDDISLAVIDPPSVPRKAVNDLLLFADGAAADAVIASLQALYPGRMVRVPQGGKADWTAACGAVIVAEKADSALDLASMEAFAARGNSVVMDLAVYARWRGLQVRESVGEDAPTLNIVRDHQAATGFRPGDSIPWYGAVQKQKKQRVLDGVDAARTIGESSRGGVLLAAEQVGGGTVLATDLLALAEPAWNLPGSLNKYLFLGNVLGRTVRYGRHFPHRLKYDEFVKAMQAQAAAQPALRFEDEGPAHGAYRIYSLSLGYPGKPAFFLYAAAHGSEWEPAYGLLALAERLASRPEEGLFDAGRYCLKIVPIINPSGYDRNTRQNAAGVDLNRNGGEWWASFIGKDSSKDGVWGPGDYDWKGAGAFSEPEAQTFRSICGRMKIRAALDFHGNAGGRGNNRLIVLPLTGRDDNEERAHAAVRDFNRAIRDRYALIEANRPAVEQYEIEAVHWDSQRPTLIETACKGAYGFIVEVPAGYGGTYGLVMQTDIVIETCLAFFPAYQ